MMMKSFVTLVLAVAATVGVCSASPHSRVFACPDMESLAPCVCYTDNQLGIFIECINLNSMEELKSAFRNTDFPFNRITRLEITDCNLEGQALEPIFDKLTFQEVLLIDNNIGSVAAEVFKESSYDLSTFQYLDAATTGFPLSSTDFDNLKDLIVQAGCDTIPNVDALNLLNLVLSCNKASSFSADVITSTSLESLHIYGMPDLKEITGDLKRMTSLTSVVFERNGLDTGAFAFSGDVVILDLSFNKFVGLPEITGVSKDAKIFMQNNAELKKLPQPTTEPLLLTLADGDGKIYFTNDAVSCDCDLVWLLRNTKLYDGVTRDLDKCMAGDGSTSNISDVIDFLDVLCP